MFSLDQYSLSIFFFQIPSRNRSNFLCTLPDSISEVATPITIVYNKPTRRRDTAASGCFFKEIRDLVRVVVRNIARAE